MVRSVRFSSTVSYLLITVLLRYNSHTIRPSLLKCTTWHFLVPAEFYSHRHHLLSETFVTPLRNPVPVSVSLCFLPPPGPANHGLLSLWICQFHTYHINRTIPYVTFVTGFFQFTKCFQGISMPWHVSVLHSFFLFYFFFFLLLFLF